MALRMLPEVPGLWEVGVSALACGCCPSRGVYCDVAQMLYRADARLEDKADAEMRAGCEERATELLECCETTQHAIRLHLDGRF